MIDCLWDEAPTGTPTSWTEFLHRLMADEFDECPRSDLSLGGGWVPS